MSLAPRAAAAALLLLALVGAAAAIPTVPVNCGQTNEAQVTVNIIDTSVKIKCPAGCKQAASAQLWGSGTYTEDSLICLAAIHAGKLNNSGGITTMYWGPKKASYSGSTKNGVKSQSYANVYNNVVSSYNFVGPALTPFIDCDKTNYGRDVVGTGTGVVYPRTSYKVRCPGGCASKGGSIYGTAAYTIDSRICLAAIHAGVMPSTGGTFTIYEYPGLESYPASKGNGVTSKGYTKFGNSFRLRPIKNLTCANTNSGLGLVTATKPVAYVVCPPNCYDAGGPVYGTGTYRTNSRICYAAMHANKLPGNGGLVILKYAKGLSSYKGSTNQFNYKSLNGTSSADAFTFG